MNELSRFDLFATRLLACKGRQIETRMNMLFRRIANTNNTNTTGVHSGASQTGVRGGVHPPEGEGPQGRGGRLDRAGAPDGSSGSVKGPGLATRATLKCRLCEGPYRCFCWCLVSRPEEELPHCVHVRPQFAAKSLRAFLAAYKYVLVCSHQLRHKIFTRVQMGMGFREDTLAPAIRANSPSLFVPPSALAPRRASTPTLRTSRRYKGSSSSRSSHRVGHHRRRRPEATPGSEPLRQGLQVRMAGRRGNGVRR